MSRSLGASLGPGQAPLGFRGGRANGVPIDPGNPDGFEGAHLVTRKQIDPVALQEDLIRRLGQDVTITLRMPSDTEPGYLRVQDVHSGLDLDVDPALLDEVLEQNAPPETSAQRFLREFDAAPSTAGKLIALRNWVARDVAEAEHQDAGQRRLHAQVARMMAVQLAAERVDPVTGESVVIQAL